MDLGQGLAQDLEFLLFLASLATASCMRIERFQHELCTPAVQQAAKSVQLLLAGFFGGFTSVGYTIRSATDPIAFLHIPLHSVLLQESVVVATAGGDKDSIHCV